MNSKRKSKSAHGEHLTKKQLKNTFLEALAPCYADPPTAAAILIVTSAEGTQHFCLNMEPLEVAHVLVMAGLHIGGKLSPHNTPKVFQ